MTTYEILLCLAILTNLTFFLWKYLPRYKTPIERSAYQVDYSEVYDEETENTLINIGEMASGDMQKCSMLLAEIYTELRRQGKK